MSAADADIVKAELVGRVPTTERSRLSKEIDDLYSIHNGRSVVAKTSGMATRLIEPPIISLSDSDVVVVSESEDWTENFAPSLPTDGKSKLFSRRFHGKNIVIAGLSPDCRAVFAMSQKTTTLLSLQKLEAHSDLQVLFTLNKKGQDFEQAALSDLYLVLVCRNEMIIVRYRERDGDAHREGHKVLNVAFPWHACACRVAVHDSIC